MSVIFPTGSWMQKPKEITALNSRLRKKNMTNNNPLPVLGKDKLDTDVESETGLLDITDVPHNSPAGRNLVPNLHVESTEGETVDFSPTWNRRLSWFLRQATGYGFTLQFDRLLVSRPALQLLVWSRQVLQINPEVEGTYLNQIRSSSPGTTPPGTPTGDIWPTSGC